MDDATNNQLADVGVAPRVNPHSLLDREWLLTNGIGGYAMSTMLGAHARRYHGWLVAAMHPPIGRVVALHSAIEQLVIGNEMIELSSHQFGDDAALHPDGWQRITDASLDAPMRMQWMWQGDDFEVTRIVQLGYGANVAKVTYRVCCDRGTSTLRVRPLTPLRDFHSLSHHAQAAPGASMASRYSMAVTLGDARIELSSMTGTWRIEPQWWKSFAYAIDRSRGQDWREDIWSPGVLEYTGESTQYDVAFLAEAGSTGANDTPQCSASVTSCPVAPPMRGTYRERLVAAADQFVVARAEGKQSFSTILAGYPWFADWGRDAMISLPGLLLCTDRTSEAASVLRAFASNMRDGLIPNRFDDYACEAHYNTVDASLWFIHAVHELVKFVPVEEISDLVEACAEVIDAYRNGTRFSIHMDDDGLIVAGDETTQLTWMDAKRDGIVMTPRHGKAIEINALWHHALQCGARLQGGAHAQSLHGLAHRVAQSIRDKFWWSERNCLHDVLIPQGGDYVPDGKLRPNQIFAVSLQGSPLDRMQQHAVVDAVGEHLLTPFGLRTLSPGDSDYHGRYDGDMMQRDLAYHNGTVWPWLIGHYCEAFLHVSGFSSASQRKVRSILQPLLDELDHGCTGQLAEIYDGDEPHRPHGCPAQAWSIAEVLRMLSMINDQS